MPGSSAVHRATPPFSLQTAASRRCCANWRSPAVRCNRSGSQTTRLRRPTDTDAIPVLACRIGRYHGDAFGLEVIWGRMIVFADGEWLSGHAFECDPRQRGLLRIVNHG